MLESIRIYLDKELREKIRQVAFDLRINRSELVRRAVVEYLEKNGARNEKDNH